MFAMRRSSVATLILILPCILFVFLKASERQQEQSITASGNTIDLTSSAGGSASASDQVVQLLSSGSSCTVIRCDCDNVNTDSADATTTVVSTPSDNSDYAAALNAIDVEPARSAAVSTESPPKAKVIYVITPTYTRPTQMADMTRFAQTLMLVKDIFWIVVEDAYEVNHQVSELLNRTGIPFVHLLGPRPVTHRDKRSGRGVSNRLKALKWLRENFSNTSAQGVIYFADDDNAYDIRVFDEMRRTQKVSVWPVGLLAKIGVSSPVVDPKTGLVIDFHDPFTTRRKFSVDMAGFAVDLQLFLSNPRATMPYKVGYEEDYFIKSLGVQLSDLEPKAHNCTQVLVWHTKTLPAPFPISANLAKEKKFADTNLPILYNNVLKSTSLQSTSTT